MKKEWINEILKISYGDSKNMYEGTFLLTGITTKGVFIKRYIPGYTNKESEEDFIKLKERYPRDNCIKTKAYLERYEEEQFLSWSLIKRAKLSKESKKLGELPNE